MNFLLNLWDYVCFCLLSPWGWNWSPFSGQNWPCLQGKSLKFEPSKLRPWDLSVTTFTTEVNQQLDKLPLETNWHLANPELIYLVKEATGDQNRRLNFVCCIYCI